jgi:hypothetical protein
MVKIVIYSMEIVTARYGACSTVFSNTRKKKEHAEGDVLDQM